MLQAGELVIPRSRMTVPDRPVDAGFNFHEGAIVVTGKATEKDAFSVVRELRALAWETGGAW